MSNNLYFLFAVLFVLANAVTGMVAVRSASKLRFVAPLSLVMGLVVSFYGFDVFLGSAKPAGVVPGWSEPHFGEEGATVLGGKFTHDQAWLLLQEDGAAEPRLYLFPPDSEMVQNLKKAMDRHGKENQGREWGFKIKKDGKGGGQSGDGQGSQGGRQGPEGQGSGGSSERSLENRPSPYKFEQPQKKAMPDKGYQVPAQEFRRPEQSL